MTIDQMHKLFDTKFDKMSTASAPEYFPEDKDILLNDAQNKFIDLIANRVGLEKTQSITDYLGEIVQRVELTPPVIFTGTVQEPNGKYVTLPADYRKMLMEQAKVFTPDCHLIKSGKIKSGVLYIITEGSIVYNNITYQKGDVFTGITNLNDFIGTGKVYEALTKYTRVRPVPRDNYLMDIRNPFKKPTSDIVLRLETGNYSSLTYELITDNTSVLQAYRLDYLRNPVQMKFGSAYAIPVADVQCELNEEAQTKIVDIAVTEALKILGDQRYTANKQEQIQENNI